MVRGFYLVLIVVAQCGLAISTPVGVAAQTVSTSTSTLPSGWTELFRVYWGTGPGQVGRKISGGEFEDLPLGLAVDRDGDIFILDSTNGRVMIFSPTGTFRRAFSVGNLLGQEASITADSRGNILLLSKEEGHPFALRIYSPTGTLIKNIALPADFNMVQPFVSPNGKVYLWADQFIWDMKERKPKARKKASYELD